ncbi:DUF4398 domain-containing protein [Haliangium sp.]|uniref:DUF4398 domain-containing protein n=1 Tax=Haliangium sp. TaxID=2663208 RepID=UPI003D1245F0
MRWTQIARALALAAVLSGACGACGGAPRPAQQYTDTAATISAAEAIGAEETPQAALHLKMARDQIAEADRLMADDEYERAKLVLDRAEADADLAFALAKEAEVRAEAKAAKEKLERLRAREE